MYYAEINGEKEELPGINPFSTGYEYGLKLADVLEPYIKNHKSAAVSVYNDRDFMIHKLSVVPKGDSVMVTENSSSLMPLSEPFQKNKEPMPDRYLVMVNPEKNNNKFYRMKDFGNGTWGAYYGRIGEAQGESQWSRHVNKPYVYNDYMYGIKLKEKLLKGYKDRSECYVFNNSEIKEEKNEYGQIKDPVVADLIKRLMDFSNKTINENYSVKATDVSKKMISEARKELRALHSAKKVETFNKHLLELMHIIPRRINGTGSYGVNSLMAKDKSDFDRIIFREEKLLDVMEGQVILHSKKKENVQKTRKKEVSASDKDILEAMGIEVYVARPEQKKQVEDRLSDMLKPKLKNVYRVINHNTQKAFDEYLKENGNPAVRQFWHGSRNENWISILQTGLVLKPDAKITGKMFGDGIYFAPSSMKSWGYTSSSDAKWTHEHSSSAFMALYATAYGKPYEAVYDDGTNWHGYSYGKLKQDHPGCSCVHAKADKMHLQNDEIIFYRQDQITINYLVEFEA